MRILLIGGTGFIGEYLAKKLGSRENGKIIVVGNDFVSPQKNRSNIEYIQTDLAGQSDDLEKLANSADIAVVMTQPNSKIIENFISSARSDGQLKKIVYLSSVLIYDNSQKKQDETFPQKPMTDYERGKCEEENKLMEFVAGKNIQLCITRLSNVYGNVKNRGLINFIFRALLDNGTLTINGKGDSVRDYIFVEDVAKYLEFLIFANQTRNIEIFNVCSGEGYGVSEVISAVESMAGKKIKKRFGPAVVEKKKIIGDNSKILDLSGIKLHYAFDQGLQKAYKNYLSHQ